MEPSPSPTPEWSTASPDEVPGTRPQPETEADPLLELYLQGQDAREADRFWAQKQGATDYLTKPYTPQQLITMVQKYVG